MGRSRGPLAAATDDDGGWFGHRSKRRRLAGGEIVDPASLGDGKRPPLFHCNNCLKDISGSIRSRCAKCTEFDLCLECLSVGVEPNPHKANHPYQVIENLAFPLIHPDWNAEEELLLLEGVEGYGVGNWAEVSEHVGTKNKTQCYNHYMTHYMESPFSPLPDMTHVVGKSKAELLSMAKLQLENKKHAASLGDPMRTIKQEPAISPSRIKIEDVKELAEGRSPSGLSLLGSKDGKLEGDQGEGSSGAPISTAKKTAAGGQVRENPDVGVAVSTDDGQNNRSIGGKKPKPLAEENKASATNPESSGYVAKRHEFDPEYDNDADLLLADMEFKDNDTETDRELKLRISHIYLARLAERRRRKDFIIERGLINLKRQAAFDRRRTKEEKELYMRTRVFLRYHTNEEHDELLAGLAAERKIRQRIEELQEMRAAGCRILSDGENYLLEKRKRESEGPAKKAKDNTPFLQGGKLAHRSNRYMKRETGDGEPSPSGNLRSNQKPRSGGHQSMSGGNGLNSTSSKDMKKSGGGVSDLAGYPGMESLSFTGSLKKHFSVAGTNPAVSQTESLAQKERELCHQCRLLPSHYLKMKEVLLGENARKGHVSRSVAYALFKIEPIKTERVYELLVSMGWIQGDSQLVQGDRFYS